ncbi:MAG TPA: autotransporter outer membrane beta-barrel domain-containing protein [Verrucomicrobiae bacterium]|nr:autotransporter outer membrane beta-barrel domain-containing protein [Verrucomicrobiae bacterium]
MSKIRVLSWVAGVVALSNAASGQVTVLTFEGLKDLESIGEYYNGGFGGSGSGPGPDYNISFSSDALAIIDSDAGGTGNFGGEPSPSTIAFFLTGTAIMNVPAGFDTGFSFYYSAVNNPGYVNVYSGPNGTGTLLTSLLLPITASDGGDPTGNFSPLFALGVQFNGIAQSVDFGGTVNQIGFDNITLGSATPVFLDFVAILVDLRAIDSAITRGLPMAMAQRELAVGMAKTATRDLNGRLYRLRANAGREPVGLTWNIAAAAQNMAGTRDFDPKAVQDSKVVVDNKAVVQPDTAPLNSDRWSVFAAGDFRNIETDQQGDLEGFDSDTFGATVGIEFRATDHLVFGLGSAYLENQTHISGGVGDADLCGHTISPYVSFVQGSFYADLLYNFALFDHDIRRETGYEGTAYGDPESYNHSVEFNMGYNFVFDRLVTGPFVAVEYLNGELEGYTETEGGEANLVVDAQTYESLVTRLGWQASYHFNTPLGAVVPQVRIGWERENLDDSEDVTVALEHSPVTIYTGNGVSTGPGFRTSAPTAGFQEDYMCVGAGVMVGITDSVRLLLDYEGQFFRENYNSHIASVRLSMAF